MALKTYFISDVHLGAYGFSEEIKYKKILSFLSNLENDSHLYILGDFFDFWFEYTTVIPSDYIQIISKLNSCKERGVKIEIIRGNHEFFFYSFFPNKLNIKVHNNYIERRIDNKLIYIDHGDIYHKKTVVFNLFSKLIKSDIANQLFRIIHPDLGITCTRYASLLSRKNRFPFNSRYKKESVLDSLRNYADKLLTDKYDIVIFGHTHFPELIENENGIYLNTGNWINKFSYACLEKGVISLMYY